MHTERSLPINNWYRTDLIRGFADMHIPNGEGNLEQYDPEVYADNIVRAGAKATYIYASNCLGLALYPSKVGRCHQAAARDIFGETVRACKRRGLHVIGYLNSWNTAAADDHPDWSVRSASGTTLRDASRYGNPCVNNDAYSDFFMQRVKEVVSGYDVDGLWVDMVGYWMPACFCDSCRRKYRERTGRDIPEIIDLSDPAFMEYIRFKEEAVLRFVERIRDTAKSIKPEITVAIQAAGTPEPYGHGFTHPGFYSVSDYLSGDFYTSREGVNTYCRLFYKLTENLPFEFMTSRCESLDYHTMNRDPGSLTAQAFAAIMNKGAFFFIDAVDPAGTFNPVFYDHMGDLSRAMAPYLAYADFTEQPLRDAAVYYSHRAAADSSLNGKHIGALSSTQLLRRVQKIGKALNTIHVDYDVITAKNLAELPRYQVIILSNVEMLSDEGVGTMMIK